MRFMVEPKHLTIPKANIAPRVVFVQVEEPRCINFRQPTINSNYQLHFMVFFVTLIGSVREDSMVIEHCVV